MMKTTRLSRLTEQKLFLKIQEFLTRGRYHLEQNRKQIRRIPLKKQTQVQMRLSAMTLNTVQVTINLAICLKRTIIAILTTCSNEFYNYCLDDEYYGYED